MKPNRTKRRTIPAGEFKDHCLRLMDEVRDRGGEVVITKRGKPVARLVPMAEPADNFYGALRGKIKVHGDLDQLVKPILSRKEWGRLWS